LKDSDQASMISAIVLAAGQSKRMGQPKMLLPWGNSTVLGRVIDVLEKADILDILVVTGADHSHIRASIADRKIRIAYNKNFANDDLLSSIQCGIPLQLPEAQATLICLGDQPQVQERTVRLVCSAYHEAESRLVVPSYNMRRGHPWLVARDLWDELRAMKSPQTPRDFLNEHAKEIRYVSVDSASVVEDLDTPQDYLKFKP
jgi:molybdenum cofactor cytidylyltransferase